MAFKHLIAAGLFGSTALTGCMTSQNFVDDDVYVVKAAELPVDTDVSDETDYNTFVHNQQTQNRRNRYYDDFYRQQMMWGMMGPSFGYSYGFGNRPGWGNSFYMGWGNPYYGGFGNPWGFYDPFYNPYGYYGYYDPYGYYNPYHPYYNPYGGYGYPYYGGGGGTVYHSPGLHLSGPRGTMAGMGGVSSRSGAVFRSGQVGNAGTAPGVRPGRKEAAVERPATARPVSATTTVGHTQGRVNTAPVPRSNGSTVTPNPGRTNPTPVRPSVNRRESMPSPGRTVSPGRSGISNGNSNQRQPVTVTPSRSSGNSGGSTGGSSRSSGSSGGGSVGKPGRP